MQMLLVPGTLNLEHSTGARARVCRIYPKLEYVVPVSRLQLPRDLLGAIRFDQKAGALAGHDFEPRRYKRDMVEKYTKRTWASDSLGATRIIRTGTSVHCTPVHYFRSILFKRFQ